MKKQNIIINIFIVGIAVFSSFAFNTINNEKFALEDGWINLPGDPCALPVQCDNTPSDNICSAVYNGILYQAFGKVNPSVNICNKILFRAW
jgi:hypothetical protein